MSDIAELKRFVKSLQQASSDQVCSLSRPVLSVFSFDFADFTHLTQEIVDILQVLKKEAKITEAVLRVRPVVVLFLAPQRSHHLPSRRAKPALLWANCARMRQRTSPNLPKKSCERGKRRWTRRSRPPGRTPRGP